MVKFFTVFNFLLFFAQICCAQIGQGTPLSQGWQRIYIKDAGSFDLPPTMEIQKGDYKIFVDEIKNIMGYDTKSLVAQPKGVNALNRDAIKLYARVLFKTTIGNVGDYEKLNFSINTIPSNLIDELNLMSKKQTEGELARSGTKIIQWFPLKVEKINDMSCFHIKYKRQLQNSPVVMVNSYVFHNNDRLHTLVLSYRLSEEPYWKPYLEGILKSLRITNLR